MKCLPPYTYVPGITPHPVSDPRGHAYGQRSEAVAGFDPLFPERSPVWNEAVALFNAGYYWEAHEAWESLWHAVGRSGAVADCLKGLIKWAAAGVKAREGRPEGVRRHCRRAAELLRTSRTTVCPTPIAGVDLNRLLTVIERAERESPAILGNAVDVHPLAGWSVS